MSWWKMVTSKLGGPVLIAVCTAVAVASIGFGGLVALLAGRPLEPVLKLVGSLFPLLGGLLVLYGFGILVYGETDSGVSAFPATDVEVVETEVSRQIGEQTEKGLLLSVRALYRCERSTANERPREHLREGAVRVVKTHDGLNERRARESVAAGTWTDDPVAAAFLASEQGQPILERLRGALDPGRAYRRRVERTLDAIEQKREQPVGFVPDSDGERSTRERVSENSADNSTREPESREVVR
jgi:hypothetical protein